MSPAFLSPCMLSARRGSRVHAHGRAGADISHNHLWPPGRSFLMAPLSLPRSHFEVLGALRNKRSIQALVSSLSRGLALGHGPETMSEGCGGSYIFRNEHGARAAILKPTDEEPLAPNNPKGYVGKQMGEPGLKPTVGLLVGWPASAPDPLPPTDCRR